jgi:NADPH-dependent 2,4-dienoyl-CoA reductase/sulfur reductase-like enzyme
VAGLVTGESIVNPDTLFLNNNIELIVDSVESVDRAAKQIKTRDGREIFYDKLVLSTGSTPILLPIPGNDLDGVFTLRNLVDAESIRKYLLTRKPRKIVFVGAGFINLEIATLLFDSAPEQYEISVVELLDRPLGLMLDSEMAEPVTAYLEEKGFSMRLGQQVSSISGKDGQVTGVVLATGETLSADMVFMNVGSTPDLGLAKAMGLEMGDFGIKVNSFFETSDPHVLSGGDCIENHHFITHGPTPIQLRGPAVIQGRAIAKRLAGYEIPFPGLLGNSATRLGDKYIAATGFTEDQAGKNNIDTVCATVESRSKHGMIPGMKPWRLKLVFDRGSERLIGGQIVDDSGAAVKEIDTVNALILGEKKIVDLVYLMCAGNPDCSSEPSLEPITIAAEQALQKLKQ